MERAKVICTGPRTCPQLNSVGAHHSAKGAHIEEVLAHPLASLVDVGWLGVFALGFGLVLAFPFLEGLPLIAFQRVAAQYKDAVT